MGGRQVKPDINYQQYEQKFRLVGQDCQAGPVQDRSCRDKCCLVTFIIMTLVFIVLGMYFVVNIDSDDFERIRDSMGDTRTTTKYNNSSSSSNGSNSTNTSSSQSTNTTTPHTSSTTTNNTTSQYSYHHLFTTHKNKLIDISSYPTHTQVSLASGMSSTQFPNLLLALPWIILISIFALILSLVLVIAISKIPKIIIYTLIIFTFILILAGIIGGLLLNLIQLSLISLVFGLIWGLLIVIMFCCYKQQFDAAIVLLKVTGNFLKQKPSVLLAPIFVMFVSYFYFAFWLVSFIAIQLDRNSWNNSTTSTNNTNSSTSTQQQYHADYHDFISIFWLFLNIFYSYFLYYVMVFLIATATAIWYFSLQQNYILKGLSYIWNSHIGSLTFASMIVAIINMLKSSADRDRSENNIASCCMCIVRCCFAFLQEIIKVLNHNAIIVMSVTGQGFVDSAKSAIYLIYNNFGLFVAVDMVEFLLKVCVLFLTILLPTGLGLLLLKLTYTQSPSQQDIYIIISSLIIIVICLLISLLTITVLSQALSCVFIFYCLDQRFKSLNYGAVNRVPGDLRGLFGQIQSQAKDVNVDNLYRDSNKHINYHQY